MPSPEPEQRRLESLDHVGEALIGLSPAAVEAVAAGGRPRDHHMLARRQAGDLVTHADDLACALVPEHHGQPGWDHAVEHGQIGVADAGGPDPDPHLPGTWPDGGDVIPQVHAGLGASGMQQRCSQRRRLLTRPAPARPSGRTGPRAGPRRPGRRHLGHQDVQVVVVVHGEHLGHQPGADGVGLAHVTVDSNPHRPPPGLGYGAPDTRILVIGVEHVRRARARPRRETGAA